MSHDRGHHDAERPGLRVTVVNCNTDHNKGASALAAGLVRRLQQTGSVGHITAIALPRKINPENDYRHFRRLCPDVEVLPSPVVDQPAPGSRVRKLAFTGYISALTIGAGLEAARARRGSNPALAAIVRSDLVVERGGPFFKGMGPPPNPSLLRYAWPLTAARRAGVPYALIGESVGPLTNPWARHVVRSTFEHAVLTSTREDISRELLVDIGISPAEVSTMLDNAFWTRVNRSPRVDAALGRHHLPPKRFVAVTCRDRRTRRDEEVYLRALADAIVALVPSTFEAAAIVPNLLNPAGSPDSDDRRMSRALLAHIGERAPVRLVEEDLGPDELAAFYGEAALVIGHRLHSLILGLVGGTSVVGIASSAGPKTIGTLALLGLSEFALPITSLRTQDVADKARSALMGQNHVHARMEQLRADSDRELHAVVTQLARERPL